MKNIGLKTDGISIAHGTEASSVHSELKNLAESSGQTLSSGDPNTLDPNPRMTEQAIARYCSYSTFYNATFSSNTYTLTATDGISTIDRTTLIANGCEVNFFAPQQNDGAVQINIQGVNYNVVDYLGNPLVGGEILQNVLVIAIFNSASSAFVLFQIKSQIAGGVPTGAIIGFAGETDKLTDPSYYLCDHALFLIASDPALYAVIQDKYKLPEDPDPAVGYCYLPDGRSEFFVGADNGRGIGVGGVVGQHKEDQMQGHWHLILEGSSNGGSLNDRAFNDSNGRNPDQMPLGGSEAGTNYGACDIISDKVNGEPRFGEFTAPRRLSINFIIKR